MTLPWSTHAVPAWVNTANQIRYQGTETITQTGSYPFSVSVSTSATIKRRGNDWLEYSYTYSSQTTNTRSKQLSGTSRVGGLWINPEVLANLQQGQQLDMDNDVHVQTSVVFIGNLSNDKKVVMIMESGNRQQLDYSQDVTTGILYRVTLSDLVGPITTTIKVVDMILVDQN